MRSKDSTVIILLYSHSHTVLITPLKALAYKHKNYSVAEVSTLILMINACIKYITEKKSEQSACFLKRRKFYSLQVLENTVNKVTSFKFPHSTITVIIYIIQNQCQQDIVQDICEEKLGKNETHLSFKRCFELVLDRPSYHTCKSLQNHHL